jgi:hypothetical protein
MRLGRRTLHFLHVSKTGGTAVKTALAPHLRDGRFIIRTHEHEKTFRDIPPGEGIFFVLRDPQTRFVSGFYSRLRQGMPRYSHPWSAAEKVTFEHFKTANQLALALGSQNPGERAAAEAAMQSIGHMRGFFTRWFESEDYFISRLSDVFFIGFQATLDADFEILKSMLGLPGNIRLPTGVDAHRTPAHYDQSLEPAAVENLKQWYRDDIRFYELCKKLRVESRLNRPPAA